MERYNKSKEQPELVRFVVQNDPRTKGYGNDKIREQTKRYEEFRKRTAGERTGINVLLKIKGVAIVDGKEVYKIEEEIELPNTKGHEA